MQIEPQALRIKKDSISSRDPSKSMFGKVLHLPSENTTFAENNGRVQAAGGGGGVVEGSPRGGGSCSFEISFSRGSRLGSRAASATAP